MVNESQVRTFIIKVTVNIGTDQNIEIAIFAEYTYTLNEQFQPKGFFFSIRQLVCEIWRTRVFAGSNL